MALDLRIVRVSIEIRGRIKTYENIALRASGVKYASASQNESEVQLTNLDQATSDYILAETSAYNLNRTPKIVTVEAGRVSYGVAKIFIGNVISSSIAKVGADKVITLKCLTADFFKGIITQRTENHLTNLSQISKGIASDLKMPLVFEATDKQIANYSHSGPALKQVNMLNNAGGTVAYVDNNTLVVKDAKKPLSGRTKIVSDTTGMIGIPDITVWGVKVKYLLDNVSKLGGSIQVKSSENPAANGTYTIYQLGFEITNRDQPFYYVAEAMR